MTTKRKAIDPGVTRRFLVECDECSFERMAEGRDKATRIGDRHRKETGHKLLALELPKSIAPP